jgi:proline dehydrogenase
MQEIIVGVPVSRQMARRFVAGETLDDAIGAIRASNAAGLLATLDFLGEHVNNQAEASVNADEYIRALQAIQEAGVSSNISIKLTAMGLAVDDEFCYRNVRRIVEAAAQRGNFVRIDMEDSPVTDRTLAIYRRLRAEFPNVGVVIQAYLYRSEEDVRELMQAGMAHLRLCKGAYDEPPAVAFQAKAEVDQGMTRLIRLILDSQDQFPGTYPAIASHDHRIINWTKAYAYHHQIPPDRFEFQMLYGIRRDLQQQLASQGYRMRVYIPYGTRWYPYFMRRLAERPANLLFFARALVGG